MSAIIGLIGVGDSLTYGGIGGTFNQPVSYFYNAAGVTSVPGTSVGNNDVLRWSWRIRNNGVTFCNAALGGTKLSDMVSAFATHVQPLIQKSHGNPPITAYQDQRPTRKYILSLMAGTNADTTNPNTHAANIAAYIATARAAGFDKVILCPLLSRTDGAWLGTPGSTTFDTTLVIPYNAIIVDPTWMAANGVDAVPRWDQEPLLCAAGAANNTSYFQDTIHPNQGGANLMYPYFNTAVATVKAQLS